MAQRDDIAEELTTVINRAQSMLSSLGKGAAQIHRRAETAVKTAKKAAKKARRTMSAEARAKIAAAQKARWAKVKKAAKA